MNFTAVGEMDNFTMFREVHNTTGGSASSCMAPNTSKYFNLVLEAVYACGILGNAAAIVALRRGERRVRNRKHLLLLTSLAANDIVALVGMMSMLVVGERSPRAQQTRVFCALRVVLRVFGIGSVCIAVTMALERYLALTRPFLYQKQVTYYVIRTALLASWLWAAALTCAPVLGLGLYYDAAAGCCRRYRQAAALGDVVYAWFYVIFGTLLCVVLVYCNLAVIRALYAISAPRAHAAPVMRRVSRSSCRSAGRAASAASAAGTLGAAGAAGAGAVRHNPATAEEVAFSRLMATLSVLFMICWLPQMVTSSLYLSLGPAWWDRLRPLGNISDLLMLLNYVLDPVLYVLMRRSRRAPREPRPRPAAAALCHALAGCFKRKHKTSTESMKTSCCPQETLVVSDSSGAELKPLRALPDVPVRSLLD